MKIYYFARDNFFKSVISFRITNHPTSFTNLEHVLTHWGKTVLWSSNSLVIVNRGFNILFYQKGKKISEENKIKALEYYQIWNIK